MYSNPLLSRITNTNPANWAWILGTGWNFRLYTAFEPLSVQFPEINNFLFWWLQPALQSEIEGNEAESGGPEPPVERRLVKLPALIYSCSSL
jgi:hypothetical protein